MAWSTTDFSTLQSIAKIESEINNMVRKYTRKVIANISPIAFAANPNDIVSISAITSSNTVIDLEYADDNWTLPAGVYTRFNLSAENDYFELLEGTGNVLTSANGTYTLTCSATITWADLTQSDSWQNKIDIAKMHIYNLLYSTLRTRFLHTDWVIDDIINAITNPQVLYLASDYKSLEMIYMDLAGKMSTSEAYQIKIEQYSARFASAMQDALAALDFGTYGKPYVSNVGRVVR